jgi:hypothetical protein
MSVEEGARQLALELLAQRGYNLGPEGRLDEVLPDDLAAVMCAVEDHFGVELPDSEVGSIGTVGHLVSAIAKLRPASDS